MQRRWSGNGKRRLSLCLVGLMLGPACGSGGGNNGAGSIETDTDAGASGGGDSGGEPSNSPGNLPNLGTDSPDEPEPEPADCAVLTLTPCVTAALDELTQCLAGGHGGRFGADTSRCELPEADAVVTFSQAVPRWNTAFALSFTLDVAGQTCASYAERTEAQGGAPGVIALVTAQHAVTLESSDDQQQTLTCDGTSVSFRRPSLAQCRAPAAMPTPELIDQTLDGTYSVGPMLQSNTRVFNCRFASN